VDRRFHDPGLRAGRRRGVNDARTDRRLFAALLLIQTLVSATLTLTQRIPKGHDTLSVYILQYLFQAHASSGAPLLWMPNFAHGIVSTWFAGLEAAPLQSALLLAGGVPSGTPMLPLFYAGLFVEDLILLIGIWRLGQRFYRRPSTRFFVATAAVGSSLWITNIYWNHRLIYAVPLLISLLLDFLETGSRPRLFLAVSLGCLQLLGNALYIPVLSTLAVLLFIGVHLAVQPNRLRLALRHLRPRASDVLWIAAMAAMAGGVCCALVQGLGSIRQFHPGRNPDGSVPLDAYLTYPGGVNPLRYLDFFVGLTPSSDYSLYCGLLTALFALLAFVQRPGKDVFQLAAVLVLLLFLSVGYLNIVAATAYYAAWPLHFFRYIGLAAPLVKILLLLLAGFGFEAWTSSELPKGGAAKGIGIALAVWALLLGHSVVATLQGRADSDPVVAVLELSRLGLMPRPGSSQRDPGALPGVALVSAAAAALFLWRSRTGGGRLLVPLLLALQVADVYAWRLRLLHDGTVVLPKSALALHEVRPLPYIARRTMNPQDSPRYRQAGDALMRFGAEYDYMDAFFHRDASWSSAFVTQWSSSVDVLLRAHAGRPLAPDDDSPPGLPTHPGPARTTPEAYAKAIGESEDKLQVFSSARVARSDEEIAEWMNRRDFDGNVLLLSRGTEPPVANAPDPSILKARERLPVVPRVVNFRGDRIRVEVELPADVPSPWLVYCDAWHPDWKATVDGAAVPIERANLAYKAIRLSPGRHEVEFAFHAPLRSACTRVVGILALFWCLATAAWTLALLGAIPTVDRGPRQRQEGIA
jgi:hypothetical protein